MLLEIHQIKRFLARKYSLPLRNPTSPHLSVIEGDVPDSFHLIPLGEPEVPTIVEIRGGLIYIDPIPEETQ